MALLLDAGRAPCSSAGEPNVRAYLTMIAAVGALTASEPAPEASPRQHLATDLRQQYRYAPPVAAANPAPPTSEDDVVAMAPFKVFGGYRAVGQAIEEARARTKNDAFTPLNGGTILKKEHKHVLTEVKLKFDPLHKGFDILSFSW
ncbi:MAG TPA: hypothetical protein VLT83_12195 [Opitutaceae bacterium]|nr:hypothetical protein [Opitutaceae bacterium]